MAATVASLPQAVLYSLLSVKYALSSSSRSRDIPLHPLHCALKKGLADFIIMDLIREDPMATSCPMRLSPFSEQEILPLHYAMLKSEHTTEAVLISLLDTFPHAARVKIDVRVTNSVSIQMWPLHFALQNHLPSRVVVALLVSFPEASRELIWMGNQGELGSSLEYGGCTEDTGNSGGEGKTGGILPFHLAQFLEYPEAEVVEPLFFHVLMGNDPTNRSREECLSHEDEMTECSSTKKKRRTSVNLLDYVLRNSDLHDRIPDILSTNPNSALQLMKLTTNDLSLNYIFFFGVNLKSIFKDKMIAQIRPASQTVSPLHFALCRTAAAGQNEKLIPSSLLMGLFHANREAGRKPIHLIMIEEENSRASRISILPFHLCEILQRQGRINEDIAGALFQEQIAFSCLMEEMPPLLHYVLQHKLASSRLLGLLKVAHFSESARRRMSNGDMPLHCALRSQIYSEEALLALIEAYPEAAMIRSLPLEDENEQRRISKPLPLHVAAASNTPPGVVKKLIELYPNSLIMRDSKGNTPADLVQPNLPATSIRFICQPRMAYANDGSDTSQWSRDEMDKESTCVHHASSGTSTEVASPPMSPYKTGGGFNFLALGQKMGLIGASHTPTASATVKYQEGIVPITPTLSLNLPSTERGASETAKMSSPKAVSSFDSECVNMKPFRLHEKNNEDCSVSGASVQEKENRILTGSEWTAV